MVSPRIVHPKRGISRSSRHIVRMEPLRGPFSAIEPAPSPGSFSFAMSIARRHLSFPCSIFWSIRICWRFSESRSQFLIYFLRVLMVGAFMSYPITVSDAPSIDAVFLSPLRPFKFGGIIVGLVSALR